MIFIVLFTVIVVFANGKPTCEGKTERKCPYYCFWIKHSVHKTTSCEKKDNQSSQYFKEKGTYRPDCYEYSVKECRDLYSDGYKCWICTTPAGEEICTSNATFNDNTSKDLHCLRQWDSKKLK